MLCIHPVHCFSCPLLPFCSYFDASWWDFGVIGISVKHQASCKGDLKFLCQASERKLKLVCAPVEGYAVGTGWANCIETGWCFFQNPPQWSMGLHRSALAREVLAGFQVCSKGDSQAETGVICQDEVFDSPWNMVLNQCCVHQLTWNGSVGISKVQPYHYSPHL